MSILSTTACAGGVIGCVLVSMGLPLFANMVWSISNLLMVIYAHDKNETDLMRMFIVYEAIAILGVINLW